MHLTSPRLPKHPRQLGNPPSHFWNSCQRAAMALMVRRVWGTFFFRLCTRTTSMMWRIGEVTNENLPALHACPTSWQCPSVLLLRELNLARRFPCWPIADLPSPNVSLAEVDRITAREVERTTKPRTLLRAGCLLTRAPETRLGDQSLTEQF